jgi:hypothetical protein
MTTTGTMQQISARFPYLGTLTPRTNKPIWPTNLKNIPGTIFFVLESIRELFKVLWIILPFQFFLSPYRKSSDSRKKYYMLYLLESRKYPLTINLMGNCNNLISNVNLKKNIYV